MKRVGLGAACLLGGCLQPNPDYLGQSGTTSGTTNGGQDSTVSGSGRTSGAGPTMGSGSADADTGADSETAFGTGTGDNATICEGSVCLQTPRCYDAEEPPSRVALGDVDGDGRQDVIALSFDGAQLEVWTTGGGGGLTRSSRHELDADPRSLAALDISADGRVEIAVGIASTQRVLLVNPRDDSRSEIEVAGAPVELAVGDGNLDGFPDLAIATRDPDQLGWALSGGIGVMKVGPFVDVRGGPEGLALGISDGDALSDAFVITNFEVELGCFLSLGEGRFAEGVDSQLFRLPNGVDTADLDHDGALDVVISSSFPRTLDVLTDNGDTTFSTAESIGLAEAPGPLRVVDLNLDGEPDLVLAMRGAPEILIYPGSPDLQYGEPLRVALPENASGLAVGDLNGDGRPDIVASIEDTSEVCVILADSV